MENLTVDDLKVDHVYEAKHRVIVRPWFDLNDRQILHIDYGWYKGKPQTIIQYDSPTVKSGQHYPRVSADEFLRWARRDITTEMPSREAWRKP